HRIIVLCLFSHRSKVEEEGVEEIGDDVEDNDVEADGDYDEDDDDEFEDGF
ncbi:hypothetical protein A2U01_0112057, partial [Trifolium medium]|nr:hypothetical protein [Trifolium medium]